MKKRPVTIFSGQWADLPFEEMCKKIHAFGYEGVEIACWGDHMDLQKAVKDPTYTEDRKNILEKYGLSCWALGTHIIGQCVGDDWDPRINTFAPKELADQPEEIRAWAVKQMQYAAKAAKLMGVKVVTGFVGSPIWKYLYSFPPVTEKMIESGFQKIKKLWAPILDVFDEEGVKFALEVHPGEIAFDYYTTKRLFETLEYRKTFGLNFDPSHLIWQGIDPTVFIRDFADRIYHVHMKDAALTLDGRSGILGSHMDFGDIRRGWNFRSLGHGDVNFENIIRELNAIGYTGPLSVEWEDNGMDRETGARESCEFVKKYNFIPSKVNFDGAMEN